jgi:hypothetical protein
VDQCDEVAAGGKAPLETARGSGVSPLAVVAGIYAEHSAPQEEATTLRIPEAKQYLGKRCTVTYLNRHGDSVTRDLHVEDIAFVPLYGAYLIGDVEDVCLDRVTSISSLDG